MHEQTAILRSETHARATRMLRTALGPVIAGFLDDPAVVEVMLNPDGRLWIDRLTDGVADSGACLSPADGERIVRLVAHHVGAEVHAGTPRVSAELPGTGERFEGLLPPIVAAPSFAIRKPAVAVFGLGDYVAAGIMTGVQADALTLAVRERCNILVVGGTSTGKTTLVNALLAEVAASGDPPVKDHLWSALLSLGSAPVAERTLTGLAVLLQSQALKQALQPFTVGGPWGRLLDAEAERIGEADWLAFETEGLIGTPAAPAVLAYAPASASVSKAELVAGARARWRQSVDALQDALRVQAGVVGNIETNRQEMAMLVGSSQSAQGALQAAQAGNQILALQAQQLSDLTAAVAAQGRAQAFDAAQRMAAQDLGRENLRRFMGSARGYQPTAITMYQR